MPGVETCSGGFGSVQFVGPLSPAEINIHWASGSLCEKIGAAGIGLSGEATSGMGLSEAGREQQWWLELIGLSSQPSEAHFGFSGSVQSPGYGDDILFLVGSGRLSECESDDISPGQPKAPALDSAGESESLVVNVPF